MAQVAATQPDSGGTGPKYTPRKTSPAANDKNWIHTSYGGYNDCILISGNSVLPNCVGYAWGRWRELLGKSPALSRGDAGTWYNYNDGYKRGKTAQLGAVACWSNPATGGHVAIVERVLSNGSFEASESAYGGGRFHYGTYSARGTGTYLSSAYHFQGFIYFPIVFAGNGSGKNYLALLVAEAKKHLGENYVWTNNMSHVGAGAHWCAAFVWSCCKAVGLVGKIIKNNSSMYGCGNIMRACVPAGMGTWLKGPNQGSQPTPQPGDFIFFRWEYCYRRDTYDSDHVGIVISVSSSEVITVEGNTNSNSPLTSCVASHSYRLNYSCINGYYRPNWSIVGGSIFGLDGTFSLAPLYNTEYTRADGLIREIAYVGSKSEPSIKSSSIKLSVMNYTELLASAFELLAKEYGGSIGGGGGTTDVSKLGSVPRGIVQFFMDKGLAAAVGVGVAGNVQQEIGNKWDISITGIDSNGYRSGGLIQWNDSWGGFRRMVNFVGPDWKTNLTGQLKFLWYHITELDAGTIQTRMSKFFNDNRSFLSYMKSVPNTEAGARDVAKRFAYCVEFCADLENQSVRRANNASAIWKSVVPQLASTATVGG